MKSPWLWIVSLISVGVVVVAAPVTHAADCLDRLAGNVYLCSGVGRDGGETAFLVDFSASTGDSAEFTGDFLGFFSGAAELLCACGYRGKVANPTFGADTIVSCMEKPGSNGDVLSSALFAGQVPSARLIRKAYRFNYSSSATGGFSGALSSAECARLQ